MCGICGIVDFENSTPALNDVIRMSDVLNHRGPDDYGYFSNCHVALGHRRLSIIDLKTGHQPITDESGRVALVFNGEIYNYIELRNKIARQGYSFRTHSDSEVLLAAYLQYGFRVVEHLNGDFAFAVWDSRFNTLFIARDRLGLKPLFYQWDGKKLIFASEIKSILAHPDNGHARINMGALSDYLFAFYTLEDETMFEGIKNLPAGHCLTFNSSGLVVSRYWDISFDKTLKTDPVSDIRDIIRDAVSIQLRSDVPLGITLSGGLDSSIICASASGFIEKGKLNTYTVSYKTNIGYFSKTPLNTFEGVTGDDTYYSQLVADRYGTRHTPLILDLEEFSTVLDQVILHREKPLLVMSEFGHYCLSSAAQNYITVLLTGQGGDEIFGGYYYWLDRRTPENTDYFPWVLRMEDGRENPATTYDWMQYLLKDELWRSMDFRSRGEEMFCRYMRACQTEDFRNKLSYLLVKIHLQELLEVEDRLGMASSVEIRCPLCDYRLVDYVLSLPFEQKFRRNEEKALLRDAFREYLPKEVLSRKKSQFPIPMEVGRFYNHVRTTLSEDNLCIHEYFRPDRLKKLCQELASRPITAIKYTAFRLYTLERWHRLFLV